MREKLARAITPVGPTAAEDADHATDYVFEQQSVSRYELFEAVTSIEGRSAPS